MHRVVIVGAGVSGLSAAFRIQQCLPDTDIVILEAGDRPGGTAWTIEEDGFQIDIGPNGFLDSKPSTLTLCEDLGMRELLISASESAGKNRFLYWRKRLRKLPSGFGSFLTSGILSWRGKWSLLKERFRSRPKIMPTDETIDAFARRRAGDESAEILADAMVTGIYAGDPTQLSMPACFPNVAALERDYGSVMKGMLALAKLRRKAAQDEGREYQKPGKMYSFAEGMRVLPEGILAGLAKPPIYGVQIKRVEKYGDPAQPLWVVYGQGNDRWEANAVVLTCPAHQQAPILFHVDIPLARKVGEIPYNRVAVVALGYRREDVRHPLDGFGYIAPQHLKRDVLGVQWCSSIFPGRAPEGTVLLRCMVGGWQRGEMVFWDDRMILDAVRNELVLTMRIHAEPIFHKIIRWHQAIPQYHVGHLDRVAWIEARMTEHPGLILGGNAYRGVALNDCTDNALRIAEQVTNYLLTSMAAMPEDMQ